MLHKPFFDPEKSYEENYSEGPFGSFTDKKIYKQSGAPQYTVLGQKVYTPFGIPAGPLLNGKYVKAALDKGFDIPVYKTVRSKAYPCNQWPNVLSVQVKENLTLDMAQDGILANHLYSEPIAITNSFGVPSFDPEVWQPDMAKAAVYAKKGQFVIGSFQGTTNATGNVQDYINDFVLTAKLVKETKVPVLEVNLSCPNEGTAHLLCYDLQRTKEVVYAIKEEIGNTPLLIKIGYFADQKALVALIRDVGSVVAGIVAINTIAAKILDEQGNQALPGGPGRLMSGVCGYPIKWAGEDMVKRLIKLRQEMNLNFTVIGVGGVTNVTDYKHYRDLGADAVMSATGAMWNPLLAQEIKQQK